MILDFYFARRFLRAIAIVAGIFIALILMIETLEQIRRFGAEDLGMATIFRLAALKLSPTLYELLPIIIMLSTLVLFLGLARSSELVVARASGRSALRATVPVMGVALLTGALSVAVMNPIAATSTQSYDARETRISGLSTQAFSVSDAGLWLREGSAAGQTVIHAARANFNGTILSDVTFLRFGADGIMDHRIEARTAQIGPNAWQLTHVKFWPLRDVTNPEAEADTLDRMQVPTELTPDEIRDRFGTPQAIPIWELRSYIDKLETAGFSARAHRMWFQAEMALPVTFLAMVLISAGFTMRHTRLGGTSTRVLTAILLAFVFFFLRNFAYILGENGELPVILAAWGPPLAVILATLALLLHLEDG